MRISRLFAGSVLLLLPGFPAWGGTVYSWTDAGGVTHFSESPPDDPRIESTVMDIEPAPAVESPGADDYYSVANQAARMEARRLEQERRRAEILTAEAEARRAEAEAEVARERDTATEEEATRYYPLYLWYPYGHRLHPRYRDHLHLPPHKPHPPPRRNKKLVVNPDTP
jgi:hypothetical protein